MSHQVAEEYCKLIKPLEINPTAGSANETVDVDANRIGIAKKDLNLVWYTKKQIAQIMQVHERTVSNWISAGKLCYCKPDSTLRISAQMLKDFTEKYSR